MQRGVVITGGDPRTVGDLAALAEQAGWDGVFTWDGIQIEGIEDTYDPWVTMAAIAMRTERVRFSSLVTPLSRRRPWKVAREGLALDHLSGGRFILSVGLGALEDRGFAAVGEATDKRTRAEMLDEGLAIVTGLWSGEPFSFEGRHYRVDSLQFRPLPVQRPRIPIWVVGAWPRERSMRRAIRYEGLLPNVLDADGRQVGLRPEHVAEMAAYVREHRPPGAPYDIVAEGSTPGGDPAAAAAVVARWAEAGATWWIEADWSSHDVAALRRRIGQGPPPG